MTTENSPEQRPRAHVDLMRRLFNAKEERRRELAALPFIEKARIVVELQKMAAPLLRLRDGKEQPAWDIED